MHKIYHTPHGIISQDDEQNCFIVSFKGIDYKLTACGLIALKVRIDAYDIEEILLSDPLINSMEVIPLCNKDRFLLVTLGELVELKDLISGGMVMLELHSIVHQRIVRASV